MSSTVIWAAVKRETGLDADKAISRSGSRYGPRLIRRLVRTVHLNVRALRVGASVDRQPALHTGDVVVTTQRDAGTG